MAIEKFNALENLEKVVSNEELPVTVDVDVTTANAYLEDEHASEVVETIMTELEEKATEVVLETPEAPEVKNDSIYTKKLTLDESIENFSFANIDASRDEEDRYTTYDMFDFIYNLFASQTDSLIRPLKALSNLKSKKGSAFMYQGSDDYIDELGEKGAEGISQISTDTDGNVVLYQDTLEAFEPVIALCEEYGFSFEGPTPKKAPWVRWNFSFVIQVPTYADGYPMEVEDYFEQKEIPLEDVMPPQFIKGRTKDYKKMNDEVAIQVIYDKYVRKAANSNDPLEGFIKDMFKELDTMNIKYDRKPLKDKFLAEFNDDFEDEE